MISIGANALASSIVLVCRPRDSVAPLASRGEFVEALRSELPAAVRVLQSGNIAPVDIAQSTIGPGISVFSRYAKVVEADGSAMSVAAALGIINDVLGEILDGEEAELDPDTRFAVTWYSQNGYSLGKSGDADAQARAKNTSLAGLQAAGIGATRGGDFRLFERSELDLGWSPASDSRLTVWEATQHLVAALERSETEAAQLLHQLGGYGDRARQLAYLLFQKATDKGWADEAGSYNGLITAWPTLAGTSAAGEDDHGQGRML
jgi:putative DNA methylase